MEIITGSQTAHWHCIMYSVYIATHTIVWALDILNDMDMIKTIWKTITCICKYLISKSVRVKINCSAILANVREVNIYPVIFVFKSVWLK